MTKYSYLQLLFFTWFLLLSIPLFIGETDLLTLMRASHLKIICHQILDRYFEFNGSYFIVCARCLGIYSGLFILSFIRIQHLGKITFFGLLPTIIDKILESLFQFPISNEIRFCSGLMFSVPFVFLLQKKMKRYATV